jgi:hypothetical protein
MSPRLNGPSVASVARSVRKAPEIILSLSRNGALLVDDITRDTIRKVGVIRSYSLLGHDERIEFDAFSQRSRVRYRFVRSN